MIWLQDGLAQLSKHLNVLWKKAPALEAAFYLFLGAGFTLCSPLLFTCLSMMFLGIKGYSTTSFRQHVHPCLQGALLILAGAFYTHYFQPPLVENELYGHGLIKILEKRHSTFFGKTSLYYKAHILTFETETQTRYEHLECSFYLKPQKALAANCDYYIDHIKLVPTPSGMLRLKLDHHSNFIPIDKSSSLVEWRYQQKLKAQQHLHHYVKKEHVRKFLSALTLGYLDSKTMCYEFSRVGLQHLLTISGFHFALLALFFSLFLKPFLPKKYLAITLLLLMTLYVVYLGPAPSVSRAWIAIFVYLLGDLLELKSSALNSIGLAALASFLNHPLCMLHMGFQLSYTATLGIVAFYTPCERWLRILLPHRPLSIAAKMPIYEGLIYYILSMLRKGLALDMAVNTLTIPLIFYQFGNFPLFSFFYNLIVPGLVTLTLFLLLLGLCFSFYPPLCAAIHHLNTLYTCEILSFISHAPKGLDLFIYIPNVSPCLTICTLCIIFLTLLYFSKDTKLPYGIFKQVTGGAHKA